MAFQGRKRSLPLAKVRWSSLLISMSLTLFNALVELSLCFVLIRRFHPISCDESFVFPPIPRYRLGSDLCFFEEGQRGRRTFISRTITANDKQQLSASRPHALANSQNNVRSVHICTEQKWSEKEFTYSVAAMIISSDSREIVGEYH